MNLINYLTAMAEGNIQITDESMAQNDKPGQIFVPHARRRNAIYRLKSGMKRRLTTMTLRVALSAFVLLLADQTLAQFAFTTLDVPSSYESEADGISGKNIVGHYNDSNGFYYGFFYDGSNYITLDVPGSTWYNLAQGISGSNVVGYYEDSNIFEHSFLYNGSTYATLDDPSGIETFANGIWGNKIVGYYLDSGYIPHGFLYDGSGYTTLDYPDGTYTVANGISGNNIVGTYLDNGSHGFLYNGSTWTKLDEPSAINGTWANGICGNIIVGWYRGTNNGMNGFFYNIDTGIYTTLNNPLGYRQSGIDMTRLLGLDGDNIVGFYVDGHGNQHGFVATTPPSIVCPTNITVEFSNEAGAAVLFSAQASDFCSGTVPVTLVPPSGSTFPIGTNTVICTATDDAGNTNQCSFTVTVLGAHGIKEDVLAEMVVYRSTITVGHIPRLDMAIADLARSLAAVLWVDETHLAAKNGKDDVFTLEADTVLLLNSLDRWGNAQIPKSILQGWIGRLVKADRLLAVVEIEAATNAGAGRRWVTRAMNELSSGDRAAGRQQYFAAILNYRDAWQQAARLVSH